jgi:predicted RNA-binding protein YlqC (UPF0109 family)
MKEFVEYIVKQLVDKPEKVIVEEATPNEKTIELKVKVDISDIGKIIGKQGRNVQAMRTLVAAVGAKGKHRATLEVLE